MFGTRGAVERPEIVVAEAPIDALSLAAAGFPALATCGTSNLRPFPKLFAGKTIICAFDLDPEPEKQAKSKQLMDKLKDAHDGRVVWLKPPGNGLKDWNDVLRKYGPIGLGYYLRQAGAKCRPPVIASQVAYDMSKATAQSHASQDSTANSCTVPAQPADACYCCKSRDWWFHEMCRVWVCGKCHPDPVKLRMQWERRKSA